MPSVGHDLRDFKVLLEHGLSDEMTELGATTAINRAAGTVFTERARPRRVRRRSTAALAIAFTSLAIAGVALGAPAASRYIEGLSVFSSPNTNPPPPDIVGDRFRALEDIPGAHISKKDEVGTFTDTGSRTLIKGENADLRIELYAQPSSTGRICFVGLVWRGTEQSPGGGGSCLGDIDSGYPASGIGDFQTGKSGALYGVRGDSVTNVQVRTNVGIQPAQLDTNAYLWLSNRATTYPTAVILTLADGTRVEKPVVGANRNPSQLPNTTTSKRSGSR